MPASQRNGRNGRVHLRVPLDTEAWVAWGYQRKRCMVTEFSTGGLTVKDIDAEVGTPVSIQFPLPEGSFTLCGRVVHRSGAGGAAGIRFFDLPEDIQLDLELYLWDLLAVSSAPKSKKMCKAVGCLKPRKARGFCSTHYSRWRREQARL